MLDISYSLTSTLLVCTLPVFIPCHHPTSISKAAVPLHNLIIILLSLFVFTVKNVCHTNQRLLQCYFNRTEVYFGYVYWNNNFQVRSLTKQCWRELFVLLVISIAAQLRGALENSNHLLHHIQFRSAHHLFAFKRALIFLTAVFWPQHLFNLCTWYMSIASTMPFKIIQTICYIP